MYTAYYLLCLLKVSQDLTKLIYFNKWEEEGGGKCVKEMNILKHSTLLKSNVILIISRLLVVLSG